MEKQKDNYDDVEACKQIGNALDKLPDMGHQERIVTQAAKNLPTPLCDKMHYELDFLKIELDEMNRLDKIYEILQLLRTKERNCQRILEYIKENDLI